MAFFLADKYLLDQHTTRNNPLESHLGTDFRETLSYGPRKYLDVLQSHILEPQVYSNQPLPDGFSISPS